MQLLEPQGGSGAPPLRLSLCPLLISPESERAETSNPFADEFAAETAASLGCATSVTMFVSSATRDVLQRSQVSKDDVLFHFSVPF
jgi:hypothetical protein